MTFKNSSNVIQKTVAYRFDHNNNLLRRVETPYTAGVAGTATSDIFVTEGVQIVLAFHKGTSGNAALTDRFVWSPERDQLLTDEQVTSLASAGTPYHIFGDQINSVRQAATYNAGTDTTTVAKNLAYDAFGNVRADSASGIVFIFGYTARYKDSDTHLQFNGPRIYLSWAGIWGQEDPIGFSGADENLRRFVSNHPTYASDPTGLVQLEFSHESSDSIEWYESKLPKNIGGWTDSKYEITYLVWKDPCGGWGISYTLWLKTKVELDPDHIKEFAKPSEKAAKKWTLENVYAHEQRHVDNHIAIVKKSIKPLEKSEKNTFSSKEDAVAEGKKQADIQKELMDLDMEAERKHQGIDPKSPDPDGLFEVIGTMPKDPVKKKK